MRAPAMIVPAGLGDLHPATLEEAFAEYARLLGELDAADRERQARVHAVEEAGVEYREAAMVAREVLRGMKGSAKTAIDHWLAGHVQRLL